MSRDEFTIITKPFRPGAWRGRGARHWPMPCSGRYVEAWEGLAALREDGLVRSIEVSNFNPDHVVRLIEETGAAPVVDQVELHPHFIQADQRAFASAENLDVFGFNLRCRRDRGDQPSRLGCAALGLRPRETKEEF